GEITSTNRDNKLALRRQSIRRTLTASELSIAHGGTGGNGTGTGTGTGTTHTSTKTPPPPPPPHEAHRLVTPTNE
ncbi:MAG: hypothetical protein QOD97_3883, partial [Mycobacterium sp.]|nr:hypothetical protein [Mycobacterium sp.]